MAVNSLPLERTIELPITTSDLNALLQAVEKRKRGLGSPHSPNPYSLEGLTQQLSEMGRRRQEQVPASVITEAADKVVKYSEQVTSTALKALKSSKEEQEEMAQAVLKVKVADAKLNSDLLELKRSHEEVQMQTRKVEQEYQQEQKELLGWAPRLEEAAKQSSQVEAEQGKISQQSADLETQADRIILQQRILQEEVGSALEYEQASRKSWSFMPSGSFDRKAIQLLFQSRLEKAAAFARSLPATALRTTWQAVQYSSQWGATHIGARLSTLVGGTASRVSALAGNVLNGMGDGCRSALGWGRSIAWKTLKTAASPAAWAALAVFSACMSVQVVAAYPLVVLGAGGCLCLRFNGLSLPAGFSPFGEIRSS